MEVEPSPEVRYVAPGVYEHYKSTPEDKRLYEVKGVGTHTETGERFVVYVPLYAMHEEGWGIQIRPLETFLGTVDVNGERVPRFRFIGGEL